MPELSPKVTTIPANPEKAQIATTPKQLRVAAYCRVSTDDEEQLSSYEAQKNYYTQKIMTTPNWTMAGIYADEGITGTSATKRPEFLKMIQKCKKKEIDLVLVKSISRFARNTLDCLKYIRALRELGIAVIFEKENINTLESESEMMITLMGAFAQAESESISQNVRWGKRQAMREGKAVIQYKWLYAFERGEDGKPKIIPEQAEVVRRIFSSFLAGHSIRMIRDELNRDGILTVQGKPAWSMMSVSSILKNEKYCGDVLMQKTFVSDCISKKNIKNTGQLPMYLIEDHHEAIVSRETFRAAQTELARRNSGRAPCQKTAPTMKARYSARYALTGKVICGDCGTPYRRCTWKKNDKTRVVWRCVNRIEHGLKYCPKSPTIDENQLHAAILSAINSLMSSKEELMQMITESMQKELCHNSGEGICIEEITQQITELEGEFKRLFEKSRNEGGYLQYADQFTRITDAITDLKEKRVALEQQQTNDTETNWRIQRAKELLGNASEEIKEWDEDMIRQLVESVKILSATQISVTLKGGVELIRKLK